MKHTFWAIQWRSKNKLDGEVRCLQWEKELRLYRTRRECQQVIEHHYGYIRTREDLRAEPHGWRMPKPVKVRVVLEASYPEGK